MYLMFFLFLALALGLKGSAHGLAIGISGTRVTNLIKEKKLPLTSHWLKIRSFYRWQHHMTCLIISLANRETKNK